MEIYIALVHHPVYNKNKEVVTTSITTLDIHDIARTAKTYGVISYFLISPLRSQKELVDRLIEHWVTGYGSTYNPTRKEALSTTFIVDSIEDVKLKLKEKYNKVPLIVVTSARKSERSVTIESLKKVVKTDTPILILFGTGWGLTEEIIDSANFVLEPIKGKKDFNHLPVRAAVAITLDRILK